MTAPLETTQPDISHISFEDAAHGEDGTIHPSSLAHWNRVARDIDPLADQPEIKGAGPNTGRTGARKRAASRPKAR